MSYQNDVADFMKAGEQPVRSELSLEGDQATLYMNLISEEYQETLSAFKTNDMIEVPMVLQIWFGSLWGCVTAVGLILIQFGKKLKHPI